MRIDADKNGFLTWNKWGTVSKIHCPFNKKDKVIFDESSSASSII